MAASALLLALAHAWIAVGPPAGDASGAFTHSVPLLPLLVCISLISPPNPTPHSATTTHAPRAKGFAALLLDPSPAFFAIGVGYSVVAGVVWPSVVCVVDPDRVSTA